MLTLLICYATIAAAATLLRLMLFNVLTQRHSRAAFRCHDMPHAHVDALRFHIATPHTIAIITLTPLC